ncbi:MAG: hypothetical protein LLG13_03885 [Bacteroidales bacterium]|nr:hypothetical protein [Bacteroidales bacterium]
MKNRTKNQKESMLKLPDSVKILITGAIFILISLSVEAANYYVSLTGNDKNDGTSAETAWRTITYAATQAKAGDIISIKGGNYGHEHVVVCNSGTSSAPIIFQGYCGTPVLDGIDWTGDGIYGYQKSYLHLKNLKIKNYRNGVFLDFHCDYNVLDSLVVDSCSNPDYVNYGWDGDGIQMNFTNYTVIKNCSVTDNGGNSIYLLKSNNCTIRNCKACCTQLYNNKYATDYYIVLSWSSDNLVRDCHAENLPGSTKGDHGIIFKDFQSTTGIHSTNNRIINCVANNFEECFSFSHGAHHNFADSCSGNNANKKSKFNNVLMVRDGANNNTFSNCRANGKTHVVCLYDGIEGTNPQHQDENTFINCIFNGGTNSTYLRNSTNTTFKNCIFVNSTNLFRFGKSTSGSDENSGTVLRNCILYGIRNQYETNDRAYPWTYVRDTLTKETGYSDLDDVVITYTNFFNGFAMISGTGNISTDPLFAGTTDFHIRSQGGRWNGTTWVNDDVTSSCIDAGDPADNYSGEPCPHGNRINMGAYGNTIEASKSFGTSSFR